MSADQVSMRLEGEEATSKIRWLKCTHCAYKIARTGDRREVSGKHLHTFINPAGIIYKIGCFQAACGAVPVGPASTEFTWFPGHEWRCCTCGGCGTHMGWSFTSRSTQFFGLILSELVEAENPVE